MVDDLDVLDDVLPRRTESPPEPSDRGGRDEPASLDVGSALLALGALAPQVRDLLAHLDTVSVASARPAERQALVALYETLRALEEPITLRRRALEVAFGRGFEELGAKTIPLPDGRELRYEPARGQWKVNVPELRKELRALIPEGVVTEEDLERAFSVVVSETADNRVLNHLRDSRGDAVRQAIEQHRTWQEPLPYTGKVVWPRREEAHQ